MPSTLKITNIKANDGTSALTFDNSTGKVSTTSELDVPTAIKIGGTTVVSKDLSNNINLGSTVTSPMSRGQFRKEDPTVVLFTKTTATTAATQTALFVEVNGLTKSIASGSTVAMPTLTAGTDYAIWATTAGTLQADASHTSPPSANARKIGGFHYAPGGNATGTSGGDTTEQINEYSFWDLKFRPSCPDPRGMTLVSDSFWADIYLCGVDHHTNGTSKYNVQIADAATPPKVSPKFGGNGSTAYSDANWFDFGEVMRSHGKRLPSYSEFAALAYGTTEASSRVTESATTQMSTTDDNFTSKWGVIQSTGCMYIWGNHFGGGTAASSWNTTITDGRGSVYAIENVARHGGYWGQGNASGSRNSIWTQNPGYSSSSIGGRGVCNHLIVD